MPHDLRGVTVADGVILVMVDHAVGGGRPGVDGIVLDVVVLVLMPVVMDMEAVLEVALTAVVVALHLAEHHWPGR